MGTYRFLLALTVALAHIDISIDGYHIGVIAVISFFIISGLSMTSLIKSDFNSPARVKIFYVERSLRLLPQFIFYVVATLCLLWVVKVDSYFVSQLNPTKVALNFLVVPLNFFMYGGLSTGMVIPQAWSLGLEVTFYAVLPWLLIKGLRTPAFLGSLGVFCLAYVGVLDADIWGYRLLPGVLFIFLMGSYLHKPPPNAVRGMALSWLFLLGLFLFLHVDPSFQRPYLLDVLAGILCGFPIVAVLRTRRGSPTDLLLGNISYGLFLSHFLVMWLMEGAHLGRPDTLGEISIYLAASIALGAFSYFFVERPLISYRHRLRHGSTRAHTTARLSCATSEVPLQPKK